MVSFRRLALLALAGVSVASPVQVRQEALGPAEIIEVADQVVNLIKDVFDFISDIDDRQHAAESNFTQSMVGTLASRYPDKNVILFHNQDCHTNFVNGVHQHYEFDIGLGMTQGYEAFVFDSGTFDLVGDGGYINWCFQGNWNRDGNHVDFAKIGSPTPSKKRAASSSSVPSLTFDFAAKHNTTNGKTSTHKPLHQPVTYQPAPAPQAPLLPPMQPTNGKSDGLNDGQYFVQCKAKGNGTVSQGVAYYKNLVPGGNAGQKPDAFTWLSKVHGGNSTDKSSTHQDWTLPVGAVEFEEMQSSVHWQIFGNAIAETVAVNQTCGVADNGKEHFWVYKDQGAQLFEMEQFVCDSLYYAF